jgi:hypothetical protein
MNHKHAHSNVVLDFTTNKSMDGLLAGQPVAILPAELAKKLLADYANKLTTTSLNNIIEEHVDNLRSSKDHQDMMEKSISFIQERELIQNCSAKNWSAYEVDNSNNFTPKVIGKIDINYSPNE